MKLIFFKLKPVLVAPRGRRPGIIKQVGNNVMMFLFQYSWKIVYDMILCTIFSVSLRTGLNPAYINEFESLTRVDDDAW